MAQIIPGIWYDDHEPENKHLLWLKASSGNIYSLYIYGADAWTLVGSATPDLVEVITKAIEDDGYFLSPENCKDFLSGNEVLPGQIINDPSIIEGFKSAVIQDQDGHIFMPITVMANILGLGDVLKGKQTIYFNMRPDVPSEGDIVVFESSDPSEEYIDGRWVKRFAQPDYNQNNTQAPDYIKNKPDLSHFITNTVDDLVNYYLKSETYTKDEIAALIGAIQQFHYEVYESLSDITDPAGNVLYLIGPVGSGSDKYEEYVYTNGQFVKIGDTSIDLSGYVTTAMLSEVLSAYITTSDLNTLLAKKQSIHTATNSPSEVTNPIEGDICYVDNYEENIKPSSPSHIEELDVSEYSSYKIKLTKISDFFGNLTITKSDSTTESLLSDDLPVTYNEGVVTKISSPYLNALDGTGVYAISSPEFEYVNGSWEKRGNYVKLTSQILTKAQKEQARANIDVESSDNTQRRIYKHISRISDPKEGDISCYGEVFLASNLQSVAGHTDVPTNPNGESPVSSTDKEYFRIWSAAYIPNPQSNGYGPGNVFDEEEDDVWYKKVTITVRSEDSFDYYGSETLGTIEAELIEYESGEDTISKVVLKFTGSDDVPHYIYQNRPYDVPAGFITDQIFSPGSLDGTWVNATSVTFTETGNQGDRSLFQYFTVDSLFPGVMNEYRSGVWVERKRYQQQTDYNQNDTDAPDYIKNKPDLSGFITKSVDDLVYYYKKTETYTQTEVNNLIGAIQQFHYEVYPSLNDVTSPATNILYLIGPTGSGADKYEEYVYANNAFVKIGDTSIDLSQYVTITALNTALASYTTTADLTTLLAAKQDVIDSTHKLDPTLISDWLTTADVDTLWAAAQEIEEQEE